MDLIKQKQELNLVDLREVLKGRKFEELSREEKDVFLDLILESLQPSQE